MKTYTTPESLQLEQLGTFTHYIQNVQFRFVITREQTLSPLVVTHRASGKRVCDINSSQQMASLGDVVGAAKLALDALIGRVGDARIRSVLSVAELSKATS